MRIFMSAIACVTMILAGTSVPARADQTSPKLEPLFTQLRQSANEDEALAVEQAIWKIWARHQNDEVNSRMAQGIILMNAGRFQQSLAAFNDLLTMAPRHAEGWNKRATVHYLLGDFEASVRDIQRTLDLEPRHFGALSGMSLIYMEMGRAAAALKVLEKALEIHPRMQDADERVRDLRERAKGKKT